MSIETQVYPYIKERNENESARRVGTSYYLDLFKEYEKNKSYKIKWNTCAAIFGGLWLAYRAMYVYAIAWTVASALFFEVIRYFFSNKTYLIFWVVFFVAGFITFGCYGNRLYLRFIKKEMQQNIKPAKIGFRNALYFWLLSIFLMYILCLLWVFVDSWINIFQAENSAH